MNDRHKLRELLRVEEFAEALNIKPSTARMWLLKRRVAKIRVGARAIRIPASEVQRIIAAGTTPAREDRNAQ